MVRQPGRRSLSQPGELWFTGLSEYSWIDQRISSIIGVLIYCAKQKSLPSCAARR